MKRGYIIIFLVLLFIISVNAQNEKNLRVRVDTKLLNETGVIINLVEILGPSNEYYVINKISNVRVIIENGLGIAKIIPVKGKNGTETVIFSTNKTSELPSEKKEYLVGGDIFSFEDNKTTNNYLFDSIKHLDLKKEKLDFALVNFSEGRLSINLNNISNILLKLERNENNLILKNVNINFSESSNDEKYLFYKKEEADYISFLSRIIIPFLSALLLAVLIFLIKKLLKRTAVINKDEFKKVYINKLHILKRSCYPNNIDHIFDEFSTSMRTFLSKILNIKYQFTYDELINELIIKQADKNIRNDLIKFAKIMLEKSYKKKPHIDELKELIEKGIDIIKNF